MDFWQDRSVIITGITGFIGSNLADALRKSGAYIIGVVLDEEMKDSPWIPDEIIRGSICDPFTMQRAVGSIHQGGTSKPAVIFHLAAQPLVLMAQQFPRLTLETDILGTINVLESWREGIGGIVVASSDKVYGRSENLPYTEDSPLLGTDQIYEVSKLCADTISHAYWKSKYVPVRVTRCGNIYGPYDFEMSRLIPGTIHSFFSKKSPKIRSDGYSYRDFIYVDDAVTAYMTLAEALVKGKVKEQFAFNFGTEKPVRVLDVVYMIRELMGPKYASIEPFVENSAPHEIKRQYVDWSLAHSLLGWKPTMTLKDGLVETIAWMERCMTL